MSRDFFVSGTYVIIAGALVSLGTALTGFWDWWKGMGREPSAGFLGKAKHNQVWRTANWHMTVMLTVTGIVIADIIIRLLQFDDGYTKFSTTILSILAGALVSYGATYGGSLVYELPLQCGKPGWLDGLGGDGNRSVAGWQNSSNLRREESTEDRGLLSRSVPSASDLHSPLGILSNSLADRKSTGH